MQCPVCGFQTDPGVCGRCGTDLKALAGTDGEARLEIRPVRKGRAAPPAVGSEAF